MTRSMKAMLTAGICAALAAGVSCTAEKAQEEKVYRRGEKAQAGPLIYNVTEASWRDGVGEGSEKRTPQHRFLLVRLTVTNSGTAPAPIPSTELVDGSGNRYAEASDVRGVSEWMGVVRTVRPAQTEHGVIVFDAPAGDYSLRVRHQPEMDQGTSALIEVPYRPAAQGEQPL